MQKLQTSYYAVTVTEKGTSIYYLFILIVLILLLSSYILFIINMVITLKSLNLVKIFPKLQTWIVQICH